jgi:hypothetical protein
MVVGMREDMALRWAEVNRSVSGDEDIVPEM